MSSVSFGMRVQVLLLLPVLIISIPQIISSDELEVKIDAEVFEELETEETVDVIVVLDEGADVDDVIEDLPDFEVADELKFIKGVSGSATKKDISELEDNPKVKRIEFNYPLTIFLSESIPQNKCR